VAAAIGRGREERPVGCTWVDEMGVSMRPGRPPLADELFLWQFQSTDPQLFNCLLLVLPVHLPSLPLQIIGSTNVECRPSMIYLLLLQLP
jgi:hypothetical protein